MNRPQAPTAAQLQREVDRVRDRKRFQSALCRTLGALALIAAFVAAVVYMAPVLRVRGTSMSPTLSEGDVLVALRGIPCGRGDIAAFDDGTHILVKRIIAGAGDVVDIGEDGAVTVNGQALEEPYVAELARGELDVDLPCPGIHSLRMQFSSELDGRDRTPDMHNVDANPSLWATLTFVD